MNQLNREPDFDEVLAATLQHVDAPGNLLARVMAAAQSAPSATPKARILAFSRTPAWMSSAIAAGFILCGILGGVHVHHEHQQAQATRNFETATQIEDQALAQTREQLKAAGISLDQ